MRFRPKKWPTTSERQKTPIIGYSVVGSIALCARRYFMSAQNAKQQGRKRSETASLKHESLARSLRCLHEAEQTLTASTQLLNTLERLALTIIVGNIQTLQRHLNDLIELRLTEKAHKGTPNSRRLVE
jgi:hypothetical protein